MDIKKRYIVLLVAFIIAVIGMAIAIYILKTPSVDLPANANFYDKVFNFLDEWASAGAPAMTLLAVVVALGIGVASIRHTSEIQKRERKERLLNEIIEWAEEMEYFSIEPTAKFSFIKNPKDQRMAEIIYYTDVLISKARHGKIIKIRAQMLNSHTISQAIDDLISGIEKVSIVFIKKDSPSAYETNDFAKVQELNKKAVDLMAKLASFNTI